MGAPKSYRKNRTREHKLENTGERRAGKFHADAGHMEHRNEVASLEEARRRKLIVEEGICPETGKEYSSIANHRTALNPYWDGLSDHEWVHIRSVIWHKINPNTDSILIHPAGKQLVNA